MAKFRKKSIANTLIEAATGVVGGVAANLVDSKLLLDQSTYVKAGVKAAAGALLPVLIPNKMVESAGAAMVGVAGYQLAGPLGIGETIYMAKVGKDADGNATTSYVAGQPTSFKATVAGGRSWVKSRTTATASKVNGTAANESATAM